MIQRPLRISNNILALLIVAFVLLVSLANWNIANSALITGKTTEGTGTISMCVNKPPTISYSCESTANVSKEYTCDINAIQDSGESLNFTDNTDLFDIILSTGEIIFTPISSQEGSHLINITARDTSKCSNDVDSEIINLTIACINNPPTISYSCTSTAYIGYSYTCDIDAIKDSGENLNFTDNTDLFDIILSTGIFQFTPNSSQTGSHLINITVKDNSTCINYTDSEIINLTIRAAYCGDNICRDIEDCGSCADDCGACAAEETAAKGGGGGGGGVTNFGIDFTALDDKVVTGYVGDKITFTFNGITPHKIDVTEVGETHVVVVVDAPKDITVTIGLRETKGIDMNYDGIEDIKVFLLGIDGDKKAKMRVIKAEGAEQVAKDDVLPLKIEPESIKVLLRVGTVLDQTLKIKNTGLYDFVVNIDPKNLDRFIEISEKKFVMLAMMAKEITLKFTAPLDQQPGVYTGNIFVEGVSSPGKGDNMFKAVPVIVEIESKDILFDASLDIPIEYRKVTPLQEIKGIVTIFNLKKMGSVEINIDYLIKDMYGNIIKQEKEELTVDDQISFEKLIRIPEDSKEGDYIFIVQTRYGESFSTTSQGFSVVKTRAKEIEEAKQIERVVKKSLLAPMIVILIIVVLLVGGFIINSRMQMRNSQKMMQTKMNAIESDMKRKVQTKHKLRGKRKRLEKQKHLLEKSLKHGYITAETYEKSMKKIREIAEEIDIKDNKINKDGRL